MDNEKDIKFYIDELKSEECQCGAWKKRGRSFCYVCYRKLPDHMQKELYQQIFNGYEEAYDAAVKHLNS